LKRYAKSGLRYLVISNNESTDVVLYPDSGKVGAVLTEFRKTLWHFAPKTAVVAEHRLIGIGFRLLKGSFV
jgi:uncharacterized cupin superfamily protein